MGAGCSPDTNSPNHLSSNFDGQPSAQNKYLAVDVAGWAVAFGVSSHDSPGLPLLIDFWVLTLIARRRRCWFAAMVWNTLPLVAAPFAGYPLFMIPCALSLIVLVGLKPHLNGQRGSTGKSLSPAEPQTT